MTLGIKQEAERLVRDLRKRINPAYQEQLGTESHERKTCADMIDALLSLQQWRLISDAPKDGTRFLLVNSDDCIDVGGYQQKFQERSEFVRKAKDGDVFRTVREDVGYWDTSIAYCPTHFMPLPPAPEVK